MTRETIKEYILQVKSQDGTEALYNRWEPDILVEVIDQIFNNHEAQLKAKDEEIAKYQMAIDKQSKRAEVLKQLSLDKDNEIATAKMRHKLEHDRYLITEAIIKEKDEEIERLKEKINTSIEEIEYAIIKPQYAEVYLNNAIRFLKDNL